MIRAAILALATIATTAPASAQLDSEVPFITSPDNVTLEMLNIARVGPNDHVIDLGSGDGRIVITAARRFGATGLGVEIVPDLVALSRRTAREAGVADKVSFKDQDLFKTDLSAATVVTMYLLPDVNLQLRPSLLRLAPGTRIVSHDWDMGDWQPDRTSELAVPDKKVGLAKSSKVHLWVVPAQVAGLWCGSGGGSQGAVNLDLRQTYQHVSGTWRTASDAPRAVDGRMEGRVLHLPGMRFELVAGELRRAGADSGAAPAPSLRRASGQSCA